MNRKPRSSGEYGGVKWVQARICDVLKNRSMATLTKLAYFTLSSDGCPTGEFFYTKREMQDRIDYGSFTCADHTPQPEGYLQWHSWADRMSRTHRQLRCSQCGLFKIWVPRKQRITSRR